LNAQFRRAALLTTLLTSVAFAASKMQLHVVPTPIKSYRLLAMSQDEDGFIWTGSTHRVIHRYDPRTGKVENVPLPYDSNASACICARKKVYVLGQSYPRLIIYDRATQKFRRFRYSEFGEAEYPSPKPDVWYSTEPIGGRYVYLFDRASVGRFRYSEFGVIKWDTQTDTGAVIPYPYQTPLPAGGNYEARDNAIWCRLWNHADGKYLPVGIARLDVKTDKFAGWWEFPKDDKNLKPFKDPATTLFFPLTLEGKVVPFDFKEKRWCQFLSVPRFGRFRYSEFGEYFGFMGGPWAHKGRYYFSLSTYDGDNIGCDGKPYHFCNGILEFDPQSRQFEILTLEAKDAYYQISYQFSAGDEFYATGSNIREPDGTLNQARMGEVVFWQTRRINK
jgi:hypothetical protein